MPEQPEQNQQRGAPQEEGWEKLGKQYLEAYVAWLKEYASINEKAKNNNVTSDDFNTADDKFNKKIEELNKQEKELFINFSYSSPEYQKFKNDTSTLAKEWEKNNPDIMNSVGNVKTFDEAFRNIYISGAPQKNLTLPEGTNTPEAMLSALLQNNAGIAIGEIHTKENASIFIANNIKTLKNSGVDTIYLEMGEERFAQLNNASVEDLRKALKKVQEPENYNVAKKNISDIYKIDGKNIDTKNIDNIDAAHIKLFLSAKENGIEIINIDQKGAAREKGEEILSDRGIETRYSSTNFTWVDKILKDRQNKPNGKYIVFGGFSHFGADTNAKGLVDEALGLPVLAFDNSDTNEQKTFLRGKSPNGADFYLPAGVCHPDLKMIAEKVDLLETIKSIKSWLPESLHNLTGIIGIIAAEKTKNFQEHVKNGCTDVSEAENHAPPPTPKTPSATQSQQLPPH